MAKRWAGISAGLLAGAAGATAMNAVSYLDQAVRGTSSTTSPAGSSVAETAEQASGADTGGKRAAALGPLGGIGIGLGVGAVAGVVRGSNATPPAVPAAVLTGLAAMAIGEGAAVATGKAQPGWSAPGTLLRDLVPHLAYGGVTAWALHRMVDPHTSVVSRFRR